MAYMYFMEHVYRYWPYIDSCTLFLLHKQQEVEIGFWDKADISNNRLCTLVWEEVDFNVLCVGVGTTRY